MTRTLHLIRHTRPQIDPALPSHEWALADDALGSLPELLKRLHPQPQIVVSSEEPKAAATAQAIAEALDVPQRRMLGLHEQLRYTVPHFDRPEDFQAALRCFFIHPDEVVFGEESAADCRRRLQNALTAVMAVHPQPCVAVVTPMPPGSPGL